MKPPRLPALTGQAARDLRELGGAYRDRCGTRYDIAARAPFGFGLYKTGAGPAAAPCQTNADELRRLLSFGSFTRYDSPTTIVP